MKKLLVVLATLLCLCGCTPKEKHLTMEQIEKMELLETNNYTITSEGTTMSIQQVEDNFCIAIENAKGNKVEIATIGNDIYCKAQIDGETHAGKITDDTTSEQVEESLVGDEYKKYLDATDLKIVKEENGLTYVAGKTDNPEYSDVPQVIKTIKFTFEGVELTAEYEVDSFQPMKITSNNVPEDFDIDDWSIWEEEQVLDYWGDDESHPEWFDGLHYDVVKTDEIYKDKQIEVQFVFNSDAKIVELTFGQETPGTVKFNQPISKLTFDPSVIETVTEDEFSSLMFVLFYVLLGN